ncbi:uncharacterized protein LOC125531490 [Triticum urartu]|uniref:uncharacterized protein LOC125531490 n=1 Tax=Triticum urartu TaxID=4572 RepID=UPI00204487F3|nr:uncharacterized protein LOC125531490 [Triticum urartu]
MPPELHHPIGRRPWRHEVAGVAQFAMGEGASDASKAVASSTYASPWGSLCCWRTAAAPLVWCETSRSPGGWGWRMAFPRLLIGGFVFVRMLRCSCIRELADGVQYIDKAKDNFTLILLLVTD